MNNGPIAEIQNLVNQNADEGSYYPFIGFIGDSLSDESYYDIFFRIPTNVLLQSIRKSNTKDWKVIVNLITTMKQRKGDEEAVRILYAVDMKNFNSFAYKKFMEALQFPGFNNFLESQNRDPEEIAENNRRINQKKKEELRERMVNPLIKGEKNYVDDHHVNKTELEAKIESGDKEYVSQWIKSHSVNSEVYPSVTPLMIAAKSGNLDIVRLLADNKANIDSSDDNQKTALNYGIESCNLDLVKFLIEHYKIKEFTKDRVGKNVLFYSVISNSFDISKYFVETSNVNPFEFDNSNNSAFKYCVDENKTDFVKLFLSKSLYHNTYFRSVMNGCISVSSSLELKKSEGISTEDEIEEYGVSVGKNEQQYFEKAKILIKDFNANPNAKDRNGFTPLMHAFLLNDKEFIKYLLNECKVDLKAKDYKGNDTFFYATNPILKTENTEETLIYDIETLKLLAEKYKADNIKPDFSIKGFRYIIDKNDTEVIKFLIDVTNFDVNYPLAKYIDDCYSPSSRILFNAVMNHNLELTKYLIEERHANMSVINSSIFQDKEQNEDLLAYILDKKGRKMKISANSDKLLLLTVKNNHFKLFKSYLKYGYIKKEGIVIEHLYYAMKNDNIDFFKYLAENSDLDINTTVIVEYEDFIGYLPLIWHAIRLGKVQFLKYITEKWISVLELDSKGMILLALDYSNYEILKYLINDLGIDPRLDPEINIRISSCIYNKVTDVPILLIESTEADVNARLLTKNNAYPEEEMYECLEEEMYECPEEEMFQFPDEEEEEESFESKINGDTFLLIAIEYENAKMVEYLINTCHADIKIQGKKDVTPFHLAVSKLGSSDIYMDIVTFMIYNCEIQDELDNFTLTTLLSKLDLETFKYATKDIKFSKDIFCQSFLSNPDFEKFKYMINNCDGPFGRILLTLWRNSQFKCFMYLSEEKNVRLGEGKNPFCYRLNQNLINDEIIQYIVANYHPKMPVDGDQNYILTYLLDKKLHTCFKYFIEECNIDINNVYYKGNTLLTCLVRDHIPYEPTIEFLINECNADVNARNKDETTPIIVALSKAQIKNVKLLYKKYNAKVDTISNELIYDLIKEKPLSLLVPINSQIKNSADIIFCLIDIFKLDVNAPIKDGKTILDIVSSYFSYDYIKILVEKYYAYGRCIDKNAVFDALEKKDERLFSFFLYTCNFIPTNKVQNNGKTLLAVAAQKRFYYAIKLLYAYDISDEDIPKDIFNLATSSPTADFTLIKCLTERCNPDLNTISENALFNAIEAKNLPLFKYLVKNCHADYNLVNIEEKTPLYVASKKGYGDFVMFLINECHDNIDNLYEYSLYVAVKNDDIELLRYYVEACNLDIYKKRKGKLLFSETKDKAILKYLTYRKLFFSGRMTLKNIVEFKEFFGENHSKTVQFFEKLFYKEEDQK